MSGRFDLICNEVAGTLKSINDDQPPSAKINDCQAKFTFRTDDVSLCMRFNSSSDTLSYTITSMHHLTYSSDQCKPDKTLYESIKEAVSNVRFIQTVYSELDENSSIRAAADLGNFSNVRLVIYEEKGRYVILELTLDLSFDSNVEFALHTPQGISLQRKAPKRNNAQREILEAISSNIQPAKWSLSAMQNADATKKACLDLLERIDNMDRELHTHDDTTIGRLSALEQLLERLLTQTNHDAMTAGHNPLESGQE